MLDSPHMAKAREAVRRLLVAHEPFPAVAIDRQWNLLDANAGIALFTGEVERELLAQPVNVLRLSLHPNGLAPRIVNLFEWRAHLLARLKHDIALTADEALVALSRELESYPCPDAGPDDDDSGEFPVFVPLRIRHDGAELAFLSTVTKFGTARDVTIEEISIESFFPANDATKAALGRV